MTRFLTPAALDFLWESVAAGELPYPLAGKSHGATMDERRELRQRVFEDLRDQRVLDDDGRPSRQVSDWLTLLAHGTQSIDAVHEEVVALAVGTTSRALLATQDARGLTLRPIDPSGLASSVVALLPAHPRGTARSITMPMSELPRAKGADREVLDILGERPPLRAGQLAANARDQLGGRKRAPVLSWFDTISGRYLTYSRKGRDGAEWVTIAPADAATLRHRLGELLRCVGGTGR